MVVIAHLINQVINHLWLLCGSVITQCYNIHVSDRCVSPGSMFSSYLKYYEYKYQVLNVTNLSLAELSNLRKIRQFDNHCYLLSWVPGSGLGEGEWE